MVKKSKCDADNCHGSSGSRNQFVSCELCTKQFHLKCASLSNQVPKTIRDCPGACWLCFYCRDPNNRNHTSAGTLDLILQRTTSALNLIGGVMDTLQVFCRMYSHSFTRTSCSAQPATSQSNNDNGAHFQQQIDELQFNLSNIFDSIMGDSNKRPRTSSISRPSLSQPDKILKVDVPMHTNTDLDTTTVPLFSEAAHDATQSSAVPSLAGKSTAAIPASVAPTTTSEVIFLNCAANTTIANANTTSTAAIDVSNAAGETNCYNNNSTHNAAIAPVVIDNTTPAAAVLDSNVSSEYAAKVIQPANNVMWLNVPTTHQHDTLQNGHIASTPLVNVQSISRPSYLAPIYTINQATSAIPMHAQNTALSTQYQNHPNSSTQCKPTSQSNIKNNGKFTILSNTVIRPPNSTAATDVTLAVAGTTAPSSIPTVNEKWFYLTRFMPHESESNIILYASKRINCNPDSIRCHKRYERERASIDLLIQ